jgi:VWFA-related protein
MCWGGAASGQEPESGTTFRSGVDLVALAVTVQSHDGSFVRDLNATDFRVYENGVEQPISTFGAGDVPVDLVLMIDTSASMAGKLPAAQHAAGVLVNSLGPRDRAAVLSFGRRILQDSDLTGERDQVLHAIGNLRLGGATPLYDAVYVALKNLQNGRRGPELRRSALVVLTDGDDTASHVTFDAVQELAREVGVAVYTVSLRSVGDAETDRTKVADFEMRALARDTGARSFFPAATDNLDRVYASIARELANQYSVGYVPASRVRHKFMRISVVVDHRDATVRARSGYIAAD